MGSDQGVRPCRIRSTGCFGAIRLDLKSSTSLLGLKSFNLSRPPPAIDFRNYIPGLLDAPVYRADGTTRLSGTTGSMAELWIGTAPNKLGPLEQAAAPGLFGSGERAGYLGATDTPR